MHRGRVRALLGLCLLALAVVWPAVAPTPSTAQEDDETVVLAEDAFDDAGTGTFFASEADDYRFSYDEGRFVMESIGDFSGSLNAPLLDVVADGTIAIDARLRGPVEGRYLVVGCRSSHAGQAYEFLLDPTAGTVALYTGVGEGSVELVPQTVHESVRTGARTNRIELACLGETITGRVNDVEVFTVADGGYERGSFYVGGATFSGVTGHLEAVFDNLLVTVPAGVPDRDGARELDRLRDEAAAAESLFGPARGELRPSASEVAFRASGVDVADFYATATFTAPYDATEHHWDAGFAFGDVEDGPYRLMVISTSRWYLTIGAGLPIASGLIDGLETTMGDANEIALAVAGDTGHLAVNGNYVAAIELPESSRGGDVWIGTAFYGNSFVEGEATAYRAFEVWALGDVAPAGDPDDPDADEDETPEADGDRDLPRIPFPRPSGDAEGQGVDEDPDATPAIDAVTVPLAEMEGSGLSGEATLTAEGDGTKVALRVRDVPGETIAVIQEGPCTALAEPEYQLSPLNAAGVSVTRRDVTLDHLLTDMHAIVVYDEAGGETTLPLVRGEIESQ